MTVLVGTSGWQYKDWRDVLYPQDRPQRLWLEEYARHFATVESNAAFYRLPEEKTFADWRERTPDGFVMAVKASRYLTHIKRLRDPQEPVGRLRWRGPPPSAPGSVPSCSNYRPRYGRTPGCWTTASAAFPPVRGWPSSPATPRGGPRRSVRCWSGGAPRCAGRTAVPDP